MKNRTIQITNKKKPAPFYAPGSHTPVTKKEVQERMLKRQRAEKIGASITRFTDGDEVENPYRVKALVYINRGEEIPKDLLVAMQKFDEEHKCGKTNQ